MRFRFEAVPGALPQTPFEPSDGAHFIWRTGGSGLVMSHLFSRCPGMTELDHFPMGYTSLWILQRLGLWRDGERVVFWPQDKGLRPPTDKGGFFGFDAGQEPSHWRQLPDGKMYYGFATEAEAAARCHAQAQEGRPMVLAQLVEDVGWH